MSSPKRPVLFLSWFAWSLLSWLALAGAVFALIHNPDKDVEIPSWHWGLALALPSAAVFCGWHALRAAGAIGNIPGFLARVIFWIFAIAGFALTAALLQGRLEVSAEDHELLLIAALLPVALLLLVCVLEWRARGFKPTALCLVLDIPVAVVCLLVLLVAGYFTLLKTCVEPLRLKAGQRWADIGHPMPEFEKTLQPVQENQSLSQLTDDLRPFGIVTLYKGSGGSVMPQSKQIKGNSIQTPPELMDLYVASSTIPGDRIRNVPKATAWLDTHANDFNNLYQGILQRDPPAWNCNPADGLQMHRVPDFSAAAKVAELICSDAYKRLQKNDTKGAADAISAGLRMFQNLGEQPFMVSNMTRANIEAMFAPVLARLPAAPDDVKQLADEVAASRKQFATTVQWEAWSVMHYMEPEPAAIELKSIVHPRNFQPVDADIHRLLRIQPLPTWLGVCLYPEYRQSLGRFHASQAWLYEADLVRISERAPELASKDLGAGEMEASILAHLSPYASDWTHAWLRINFTLLIHEQAVMIRYARAQMQAGKTGDLGAQQSLVIPGSKWEINGDTAKNSFTLKLSPVPAWAKDDSVMGSVFFMIPLDGWRPWQLLPVPPKQP